MHVNINIVHALKVCLIFVARVNYKKFPDLRYCLLTLFCKTMVIGIIDTILRIAIIIVTTMTAGT